MKIKNKSGMSAIQGAILAAIMAAVITLMIVALKGKIWAFFD